MQLLHDPQSAAAWLRARVQGVLSCDSRDISAGDGFVAWPGAATDGRRFVRAALDAGAAACLVEHEGADAFGFSDPRIASCRGLKAKTGPIAALFHDRPSEELAVFAVTGTNGKTSTAWWLAQALGRATAMRFGVVGTLGIGVPPAVDFTGLTTPDPVRLQREFRQFVKAGFGGCAIEASSIGIAERRLDGTRIRVAIFTNFTRDHLDYHGTMEAYWAAKAELFAWPGLQAAVVNVDDERGDALAARLTGGGLDLWTVSCARPARLRANRISHDQAGLSFEVHEHGRGHSVSLTTSLIGQYNVANLLGVIGALRAHGVDLEHAVAACAHLQPVPGRMECAGGAGEPLVVVDYAHTPDALDKVLGALRPAASGRGGRLWCVMGCGGNRDATKRPLMAAVAEKNSDQVVVTSDNPRDEKPEHIISQILLGLSHREAVQVQADRAKAIAQAVRDAADQDVVLIAGKGHEQYQEIAGVKYPFSDMAHAVGALRARARSTEAAGETR